MKVAVVKYNAGNIRSVLYALNRLGYEASVTDDPKALRSADRVIFPGVGEASSAMAYLRERGLDQVLVNLRQPFLGICLGMQLMCASSEENNTRTLGIFDVPVVRFTDQAGYKIPHMGWNTVEELVEDPLLNHLPEEVWCYFVHSYYVPCCAWTIGKTQYADQSFTSILHTDNFYGCQFHPEKSGESGMAILRNFLGAL